MFSHSHAQAALQIVVQIRIVMLAGATSRLKLAFFGRELPTYFMRPTSPSARTAETASAPALIRDPRHIVRPACSLNGN